MTHGYNAETISLVENTSEYLGGPTSRGQAVVDKIIEAHGFAQTSMAVAQQEQERYANSKREASISYKVGDKVWLNLKNISTERPNKKLDWVHA